MNNGNGNGSEKVSSTVLNAAKEAFAKRKSPASDKEVKAAWAGYFKAHERVLEAEKAVDAARAEQTKAVQELVAVRGAEQQRITGKGVGRIHARGDAAYIIFLSESGPELTL